MIIGSRDGSCDGSCDGSRAAAAAEEVAGLAPGAVVEGALNEETAARADVAFIAVPYSAQRPTISFGLPYEPEDSQYGKYRPILQIQYKSLNLVCSLHLHELHVPRGHQVPMFLMNISSSEPISSFVIIFASSTPSPRSL